MLRILVVSDHSTSGYEISGAFSESGFQLEATVDADSNWAAAAAQRRPDALMLVLEAMPDNGLQAVRSLLDRLALPIVVFVERGSGELVAHATRAGVSAFVVNGLQPQRVPAVLTAAITRFREVQALRDEVNEIRARLDDRVVIERAKGLLMQQKGLSEEDAFKTLRKLAMDRNKRLRDIASGLLDAAELIA